MIKINNLTVETHETEWGFEFKTAGDDAMVVELDDEDQAKVYLQLMDGRVVVREIFTTSWADAPNG